MIRAVRLAGFKAFTEPVEVRFADLTLLTGENGSGKSSVLHALLALRQTVDQPPDDASLRLDGPLAGLGGAAAASAPETVVEVDYDDDGRRRRFRAVCAADSRRGLGRLFVRELSMDGLCAVAARDAEAEAFTGRRPLFALRDRWVALRGLEPAVEVRRNDGRPTPTMLADAASIALYLLGTMLLRRLERGDLPAQDFETPHRARAVERLQRNDVEGGAYSLLHLACARRDVRFKPLPRPLRALPAAERFLLEELAHLVDIAHIAGEVDPLLTSEAAFLYHDPPLDRLSDGLVPRPLARRLLHLGPGRDQTLPFVDDDFRENENQRDLGPRGERAAACLHRHGSRRIAAGRLPPGCPAPAGGPGVRLADAVDLWLRHLRLAHEVLVDFQPPLGLALRFRIDERGPPLLPANVGAGVRGVLPLLVLGLLAGHADTLLCEQPDAHLHPDAGRRLHAFYDALCGDGVQVVLETNDRDLLEQVRERVDDGRLDASRAAVAVVRRPAGVSRVHNVDVAETILRGAPVWGVPP